MKEDCSLTRTLFLLYYGILLHDAHLSVFVDDIVVRVAHTNSLWTVLEHLHYVAQCMGLRCSANKPQFYQWGQQYEPGTLASQGQQMTTGVAKTSSIAKVAEIA